MRAVTPLSCMEAATKSISPSLPSHPVLIHPLRRLWGILPPAEEEEKRTAEEDRERTPLSRLLKQSCDIYGRRKTGRRSTLPARSAPSLLPGTQQQCNLCFRGCKLRWGLIPRPAWSKRSQALNAQGLDQQGACSCSHTFRNGLKPCWKQ